MTLTVIITVLSFKSYLWDNDAKSSSIVEKNMKLNYDIRILNSDNWKKHTKVHWNIFILSPGKLLAIVIYCLVSRPKNHFGKIKFKNAQKAWCLSVFRQLLTTIQKLNVKFIARIFKVIALVICSIREKGPSNGNVNKYLFLHLAVQSSRSWVTLTWH